MKDQDDSLADLEARLRAWRPVAVPSTLLSRLLAAEPRPRRRWHRALRFGAWFLMFALLGWIQRELRGPEEPPVARRAPETARLVEAAWAPGERLTMNLATGMPADDLPATWRLDGDSITPRGLFPAYSADGKLPLKVDCQF